MDILKIKNEDGTWASIPAIIGPQGPAGEAGPKGDTGSIGPQGPAYTLTEEDKKTIVDAVLAALPNGNEVAY